MAWWHAAREWIATAVARDRHDQQLDDEIAHHLDLETARLVDQGVPLEEARQRAVERFGNPRRVAQATRDERGGFFMAEIMQDVRWALRSLRRSPGFALASGGVLALAIAMTTAVFSVVNAVLLRPLPYAEPDRLVAMSSVYRPAGALPRDANAVSLEDVAEWRSAGVTSIAAMGAFANTQLAIRVGEQAFSPVTALVDPEFLGVLGVPLARGSHFQRGEPGVEHTAIITHRLWLSAFGGDSAIGRSFSVDGRPFTVRGVLPSDFQFPRSDASFFTQPVDLVILYQAVPGFPPSSRQWLGIARLREGVTIDRANEDMRLVAMRAAAERPELRDWSVSLVPLAEATTKHSRAALLIVLGVAGVLLAIAAFNVMNLQLSRGVARVHALAIARAMGCSTGRLFRQLLIESALLSVLSGVAGIAVAAIFANTLVALSPVHLPISGAISIDARVVLFVLSVCVVVALVAGLLPAMFAARSSDQVVRSAGGRATGGGAMGRVQRGFCVAQIALGVGMLSLSGALVGELLRLRAIDPGFRTERVLGFAFSLPTRHPIPERRLFYQAALDEVRSIPGVESAGLITMLPPALGGVFMPVAVVGEAEPSSEPRRANHMITSVGYFETMGMAIRSGRGFVESDNEDGRSVIVVNEAFARRFTDGNPIGKLVRTGFGGGMGSGIPREIIGVVADVHDRGVNRAASPTLYIPFRQFALPYGAMTVRTSVEPLSIVPEVRRRLQRVNNSVPLVDFQTLSVRLRESLAEPRFYTYLATLCAGMALLFVTLGLYGIVSFSVSRRTSEFGVRMAVGASGTAILRLVLRQAALMAGLGAVIGLALALASARVLGALPFQVRPPNPLLLGGSAALVILVVVAAGYAPARRASRVSPLTALRSD